MREGLIFDTSVWIDFFLGKNSKEAEILTSFLMEDKLVFTCPIIIQEVLQGIHNDLQFKKVKESFLALPVLTEDPVEAAIVAAEIYRKLRKIECIEGSNLQRLHICRNGIISLNSCRIM